MTRIVTVAGAQLGPVQLADDRASVVERMIVLLQEAASQGSDLVVFPDREAFMAIMAEFGGTWPTIAAVRDALTTATRRAVAKKG